MKSHTSTLVTEILAGDPRAVARAITAAENGSASSIPLLRQIFPHTGGALVVGITGAPGTGKSTLVDRLAVHYRKEGHRVAVVAIDPSSPFSGGAILGDRIRMRNLSTDSGCFVRSMATRGNLGGLSRATADAIAILDAAGFNRILVETVGVGQDEVDIVRTADICLVVLMPSMGDDIQALKAGVMEIGDVFVVNKSDLPGVMKLERELEMLLGLSERKDGWAIPIVKTVATEDQGLDSLASAIASFSAFLSEHGALERRVAAARERMLTLLRNRLTDLAIRRVFPNGELETLAGEVARKEQDPYSVVERIIEKLGIAGGGDA